MNEEDIKQPSNSQRANHQLASGEEAPHDSSSKPRRSLRLKIAAQSEGDTNSCDKAKKSPTSDEEIKHSPDSDNEIGHRPDSDGETNQGSDSGDETEREKVVDITSNRNLVSNEHEMKKSPATGSEAEKSPATGSEADKSPATGSEVDKSPVVDELKTEEISVSDLQTEKSPDSVVCQKNINSKYFVIIPIVIALFGIVCPWYLNSSPTPEKTFNLVEIFSHELDKVKSSFPSQQNELWRRSRIHLQKHLNLTNPKEPVSLILTSGHGAEKTLHCLARQLAQAFSNAFNSSVLDIDGSTKHSQDSDQVKLDIDRELKEAFEGRTRAAVIHRFEELPPGSTLIFYRYCDHENSAFKNVFLTFTVMLEKEQSLSSNINLGIVEEMVQEHLQEKFISSDRTAQFNQMDVDKLSGLWSRISHVILPVAAEQTIEQNGCITDW